MNAKTEIVRTLRSRNGRTLTAKQIRAWLDELPENATVTLASDSPFIPSASHLRSVETIDPRKAQRRDALARLANDIDDDTPPDEVPESTRGDQKAPVYGPGTKSLVGEHRCVWCGHLSAIHDGSRGCLGAPDCDCPTVRYDA